jgi:hypothetical protein
VNLLVPVEKLTDWEWFQSPASDIISSRIETNLEEQADKVVRDFTASTALSSRLSTSKAMLSDINNHDLPGLGHLLKHKQRL